MNNNEWEVEEKWHDRVHWEPGYTWHAIVPSSLFPASWNACPIFQKSFSSLSRLRHLRFLDEELVAQEGCLKSTLNAKKIFWHGYVGNIRCNHDVCFRCLFYYWCRTQFLQPNNPPATWSWSQYSHVKIWFWFFSLKVFCVFAVPLSDLYESPAPYNANDGMKSYEISCNLFPVLTFWKQQKSSKTG